MEIFAAYGYKFTMPQYYQYRLVKEDPYDRSFFDWYWTTGSLVRTSRGNGTTTSKSLGTIVDPEKVCLFINKNFYA